MLEEMGHHSTTRPRIIHAPSGPADSSAGASSNGAASDSTTGAAAHHHHSLPVTIPPPQPGAVTAHAASSPHDAASDPALDGGHSPSRGCCTPLQQPDQPDLLPTEFMTEKVCMLLLMQPAELWGLASAWADPQQAAAWRQLLDASSVSIVETEVAYLRQQLGHVEQMAEDGGAEAAAAVAALAAAPAEEGGSGGAEVAALAAAGGGGAVKCCGGGCS